MQSVEQVAGAMGEADADTDAGAVTEASMPPTRVEPAAQEAPEVPASPTPADPWAALLEAGAGLLQGLAAARAAGGSAAGGSAAGTAPFMIERDPVTGAASVRLPLPDPAVLQRLAKAFEPWLR